MRCCCPIPCFVVSAMRIGQASVLTTCAERKMSKQLFFVYLKLHHICPSHTDLRSSRYFSVTCITVQTLSSQQCRCAIQPALVSQHVPPRQHECPQSASQSVRVSPRGGSDMSLCGRHATGGDTYTRNLYLPPSPKSLSLVYPGAILAASA